MSLAKQKGNRLEYQVAQFYQRKLDKDARRMPTSGALSNFKSDILKRIYDGWSDECKSRAKIAVYDWWEKTVRQSGSAKPVLHIKANNKEILTIIRASDYFDMREELQDWRNQQL
jgi:hypothetical protein